MILATVVFDSPWRTNTRRVTERGAYFSFARDHLSGPAHVTSYACVELTG